MIECSSHSAEQVTPPPERIVVATWNLEWFFDDYTGDNFSDLAKQQSRRQQIQQSGAVEASAGVAKAIARMKPTILSGPRKIKNRRVLLSPDKKAENRLWVGLLDGVYRRG